MTWVLVIAGAVIALAGLGTLAWLGHSQGAGLGWLVSRPTVRQVRMLRRGRNVPGRFMFASLLSRRRDRKLP